MHSYRMCSAIELVYMPQKELISANLVEYEVSRIPLLLRSLLMLETTNFNFEPYLMTFLSERLPLSLGQVDSSSRYFHDEELLFS